MSQTKIKTLYPHPFSKAYWKDAAGELKDTRVLVFAALMIALRVAMKLVAIPLAPGLKINTAFIVNALGAMVFGPVVAAICAVATDILGYLQNPEGVYFVPFVLTEVAGSVIFALFLYRAKVTTTRVMLSRFSINLFINVLLQTPIMMWYYALYMNGKQYTFAMAVPGTVLGVGFIRGFANGVFRTGFLQGLYGTGAILVIVFVVRSLPVGTRSGISALRQIDKSIEESAYDLGAGSGRVFMTVTLPLIKDSFFSGLVTTFVRSITAISAIILLVTPRYLLITCRINEFAEKGAYGVACAYATILILIVYAAILIMNLGIKYFGTSKQVRLSQKGE